MAWHGYYLISEAPPGWDNSQCDNAHRALKSLGKQSDTYAHNITHSRANLANTAWIIEGVFEPAELTREYIVATVASELGLSEAAVNAKISYQIFADGESWEDSRDAANAYVAANKIDWESDI